MRTDRAPAAGRGPSPPPDDARHGRAADRPLGTGARACIGRQFALHDATLVLGLLLRRYELRADPGYRLSVTERLTLMPEGLRLHLERRKGGGVAAASVAEFDEAASSEPRRPVHRAGD